MKSNLEREHGQVASWTGIKAAGYDSPKKEPQDAEPKGSIGGGGSAAEGGGSVNEPLEREEPEEQDG